MSVVEANDIPVERKRAALRSLGKISRWLEGSSEVSRLIKLYDSFQDRDAKCELLECLIKSEDFRSVPSFYRILKDEDDALVRYVAAIGLASWNIRQGVAELVHLLNTDLRNLRDSPLMRLQWLNRNKGWGFPADEVTQRIAQEGAVTVDDRYSIWNDHWLRWFEDNKHRFPEWKPPVNEKVKGKQKAR